MFYGLLVYMVSFIRNLEFLFYQQLAYEASGEIGCPLLLMTRSYRLVKYDKLIHIGSRSTVYIFTQQGRDATVE